MAKMRGKERKILETFKIAIPKLTDREKDRLLAFSEGMAFKAIQDSEKASKEEPPG